MNVPLKKVETVTKRDRYIWTEEIENKVRRIYIRCYEDDCAKIFELGDRAGSVKTPLKITEGGTVNTCMICPYCDEHLFIILEGYKKIRGVRDIFS
jgi:hypothetical protein